MTDVQQHTTVPARVEKHGGSSPSGWELSVKNIDKLCCFESIEDILKQGAGYKPLWDRSAIHHLDGVRAQLSPDGWRRMLSGGESLVYGRGVWDCDSLFLLDGIMTGFKMVDSKADIGAYFVRNYSSTKGEALEAIESILSNEIDNGKLTVVSEPPKCVHAMGAIPKSSGGFRQITDASRPLYESVNCFMDETFTPFKYKSVDDVTAQLKPGYHMAVTDLQAAYRSVLIRTFDRKFQGLCWSCDKEEFYMEDNFVCFGTRAAPSIFTRITDSVSRFMSASGYFCVNYLDDFLVMAETKEQCAEAQLALHKLLRDLGFYISYNKVRSPSTCQRYLGIDINSVTMKLSLPEDKILHLKEDLTFFDGRRKATKRQIQRLCGILAHCAQLVRGGRTFSRRIIALLTKFAPGKRYISLTKSFKMDLEWWQRFAEGFNGSAKIIDVSNWNTATTCSDASGTGYGAICNEDWLCGCWNRDIETRGIIHDHVQAKPEMVIPDNINVQELFPVLASVKRWGHQWNDSRVFCYTDNTQVVAAINKGVSVNIHTLELLRLIFWECVDINCHLIAIHLPGLANKWPDYLSRISSLPVAIVPPHLCCRGGSMVSAAGSESSTTSSTGVVGKLLENENLPVEEVHTILL